MYAIRSYYVAFAVKLGPALLLKLRFPWRKVFAGGMLLSPRLVITSYSIHYTKLYEAARLGRSMSLLVPTNLDDYVSLLAQPLPEGQTWSLAGLSPGQQRQLGELARLRAGVEQEALALASDWQMLD